MRRWQIGVALILLLTACAGPGSADPLPSDPAAAGEPSMWFVEVDREGGYWLGPDDLQRMGVDPSRESLPALRLSWAGQEVSYLPRRTNRGWGLFFFAPDGSTRYTRRTALRLEAGAGGETMAATGSTSAKSSSVRGGLGSLRLERDRRYLPQAEAEIPWLWEPIRAPGAVTHTVALTDALSGPVTVTLHVWSHTASAAAPDHLLRLRWDEQLVREWEWDGQGMKHLGASWEQRRAAREHTLVLETPLPADVDVAVIWLDALDVTYRRRVHPSGAVWGAQGEALRIEGIRPGARVVDVTDPFVPRDVGAVPPDGLVGTVPGHRYWVGVPEEAPPPLTVRPARGLDRHALRDVSYLALAPPRFHPALEPLLEHRRDQGLRAAAVAPQAVYDAFGDGRPDPDAVRALVQSLPSLQYLLVVGDGTAKPAGYDGQEGSLRVVVPLTRTTVLGETPADGVLGTDPQGQQIVAVGRFSARSADEASAMVEKTIAWEKEKRPLVALMLSDDEPEFRAFADQMVPLIPEGTPVQRLDAGEEGSRASVLNALDEEATWLNYVGHGSLTLLGSEGILTLKDGEAWHRPTLVVAWTCLAAHFVHPVQQSMAEAWLRAPRGGTVAFLGPVGETTAGEEEPFARAFYQALAEERRLGHAWVSAVREGGSSDVRRGFLLLGDPALLVGVR